jgi:transposase
MRHLTVWERLEILQFRWEGGASREAAERFGVGESTVELTMQRFREERGFPVETTLLQGPKPVISEDDMRFVRRYLRKNPKASVTEILYGLPTIQTASSLRREMVRRGYRFDHRARRWLGPWEHYRPRTFSGESRTAIGQELNFLRKKLGYTCLMRLGLTEGEATWLLRDPKRLREARWKGLPVPKGLFPKDFRVGRCGPVPKCRKAWPEFGPADGGADQESHEIEW